MQDDQNQRPNHNPTTILASFSEPTRVWFSRTFGEPTLPQIHGWPAIQRGENTLILAPTGSGKTLTAFLWGIDELYHELGPGSEAGGETAAGIRILYVSPLKALNNDIQRNLRVPLNGIRHTAGEMGVPFPEIEVAIRSGDTPQRERRAMLRRPPHIFITTPESLYLMLTSPKARELFRTTHTVIIDEIHTLVGTKRGVHLSLTIERLEQLADKPLQRIGLSATIQPLAEAAHFLGGGIVQGEQITPRPVTVINARYHKAMDLKIVAPVADFRQLPGNSVWPALIPQVVELLRTHRSTLIFCNGRRLAERTADRLNEEWAAEEEGRPSPLLRDGVADGLGIFAIGTGIHVGPIRAHHGSISREARLEMERDLKAGELLGLVATSSLELGIDIGAIDLVVQLQSPRSISQGLQRIGRSGHLVGETSRGRFFPTYREEIMEMAAVAGGMIHGEVEPTYTPRNPLDVLAQHIVAMVAVKSWDIADIYRLVRQAYAYRDLTWEVYLNVLEMLSGRFAQHTRRELQARVVWDRVNDTVHALPSSRMLAITNGGTIPNRGTFSAYTQEGHIRLGELDEEFVYETRIGDVFMLGSQSWRVTDITADQILVTQAPGAVSRMPFWHGELPWRPYELGKSVGAFWRSVAARLTAETGRRKPLRDILKTRAAGNPSPTVAWLQNEYALDENAAWQVVDYVAGQLDALGTVASDQTLIVETFKDALGTPCLVIQSPFGGRINGPWGMALAGLLREHTGTDLLVQSNDHGILLRMADDANDDPQAGSSRFSHWTTLIAQMPAAEARERILLELPDSALFGARFRQNAARALLLPGNRPGKRTPFWLQRLRARELLQVVRQYPDFPILIETYRDCLEDALDLPHLEEVLTDIQTGRIKLVAVDSRTPSPVAVGLVRQFTDAHMYEWDAPKAERQLQRLAVNRDLLQDVLKDVSLSDLLRPDATAEVVGHLQHTTITARARTADELAVLIETLGDLSQEEIAERTADDPDRWLEQLSLQRRIVPFTFAHIQGSPTRWIDSGYAVQYDQAFNAGVDEQSRTSARQAILTRYLEHSGPISLDNIQSRYHFDIDWLQAELERRIERGELARGRFSPLQSGGVHEASVAVEEYVDRHNLAQIHRRTIGLLRREVKAVSRTLYTDFVCRWQHLYPPDRLQGEGALVQSLQQLRGIPIIGRIWEEDVWPARMGNYRPAELEALCQSGEVVWIGSGGLPPNRSKIRFLFRGEGSRFLESARPNVPQLSPTAQSIHKLLQDEGALFWADIHDALSSKESGITARQLENALLELVTSGEITNDSIQAMRYIVHTKSDNLEQGFPQQSGRVSDDERRHLLGHHSSSFNTARNRGWHRPDSATYRAARKRVAARLGVSGVGNAAIAKEAAIAPSLQAGRWSLVHRLRIMGEPASTEEIAVAQARQLLQRWGVLTREALEFEDSGWDWGAIVSQLSLMEMRGEVRRGYFVEGLPGLQFALPEAVERLRGLRDSASEQPSASDFPVVINSCDPANLYGARWENGPEIYTGEPLTFSRLPSTWQVQWRGHPVLLAKGGGSAIVTTLGANDELVRAAMQALLDHLGHIRHRVMIRTWDGKPAVQSAGKAILESLGCHRDYPAMVWEKPFGI